MRLPLPSSERSVAAGASLKRAAAAAVVVVYERRGKTHARINRADRIARITEATRPGGSRPALSPGVASVRSSCCHIRLAQATANKKLP
jgi:hypothetical protein